MNFNAPICPFSILSLLFTPTNAPIFPEGRIKSRGWCLYVCAHCKVVLLRGRGCIFHFPAVPLSHNCLLRLGRSPLPHPTHFSSLVLLLIAVVRVSFLCWF